MNGQQCIHEQEWGVMKQSVETLSEDVKDIKKDLHGNGHKGLRDTVTELSVNVKDLKDTTSVLATSINALVHFQTETETIRSHINRRVVIWIAAIGLIFTAVNVSLGVIARHRELTTQREAEMKQYYNGGASIQLRDGRVIDSISADYY